MVTTKALNINLKGIFVQPEVPATFTNGGKSADVEYYSVPFPPYALLQNSILSKNVGLARNFLGLTIGTGELHTVVKMLAQVQ